MSLKVEHVVIVLRLARHLHQPAEGHVFSMVLSRKEVVERRQDGRVGLTRVTQEQFVHLPSLNTLENKTIDV